MEKHKQSKNMARKLPEYTICGMLFTVDARISAFGETAAPWNQISMDNFWEDEPAVIPFDKEKKTVPPPTVLDPIGLARHYNQVDETFIAKEKREKILSEQLTGLQSNSRARKNKKGIS